MRARRFIHFTGHNIELLSVAWVSINQLASSCMSCGKKTANEAIPAPRPHSTYPAKLKNWSGFGSCSSSMPILVAANSRRRLKLSSSIKAYSFPSMMSSAKASALYMYICGLFYSFAFEPQANARHLRSHQASPLD